MLTRSRWRGGIVLFLGLMALLSSLGKPRVAALHGSDVLGLVAAGMCFGVAFVGLLGKLKFRED